MKSWTKKVNCLIFQTSLMVIFPSFLVSCGNQESPEILVQNLQSQSVELVLNNVKIIPQDKIAKLFKVELKKENTENYQQVQFSARRALHNNQPKILLKITDLEPDSKYVIKISRLNGQIEEQLFVKGNVFRTNPSPVIISNSYKKMDSLDPSSQFDFRVALSDQNLSSQLIDVHYRKANMIRSDYEIQSFKHNVKSDQFLYVSLKNLDRYTNYVISGLYDQKGKLLTYDNNLFPLSFRTEADIIDVQVSNAKFAGQIDSSLENIDVDFEVKFSPGVVKANTVNNYSLVFKRENEGVSSGFDQINNNDVEYIANYIRPADGEGNSFIFRVKLPWKKQHNIYKIVAGYNKLARETRLFDQNVVDSPNILKIKHSVLEKKLEIDT
ncbi:hypothetical protein [Mesomycoplasma hyopneumoniae]